MSGKWVSLGSNSRLDPKSHSAAFTVTKHYLVLVIMVPRTSFTIRTGKTFFKRGKGVLRSKVLRVVALLAMGKQYHPPSRPSIKF